MNKDKFIEWAEDIRACAAAVVYSARTSEKSASIALQVADFLQSLADMGDAPPRYLESDSGSTPGYFNEAYADHYIKQLAATKLELSDKSRQIRRLQNENAQINKELDEAKRRISALVELTPKNVESTEYQPKQPLLTPEQGDALVRLIWEIADAVKNGRSNGDPNYFIEECLKKLVQS